VQPFTLNTPDDCQTVKDRIKNHKVSGKGKKVACLSLQSPVGQMAPNDIVPDPDWCTPDAVVITRHEACGEGLLHLDVQDVETGAITGGMDIGQVGYMFTDPTLIDWDYQATQTFSNIWGDATGTTVTGFGWCDGDCVVSSQEYPTLVATQDALWQGYVQGESTTYQPGEIGSGVLNASTTFTNPLWPDPVVNSGPTPAVRCDNSLPGRGAGCVLPQVTPEMYYDLNGPYPELAQHIQYAQQIKGLPGGSFDRPLTRTTDQTAQDRNNAVACPASFPRDPGQDCDEYPFASTWEGAAFGPYDAEAIDSTQNQQGGSALLQFYNQERVLNHDPFVVTIV
jgi:hypothetical protein